MTHSTSPRPFDDENGQSRNDGAQLYPLLPPEKQASEERDALGPRECVL